MIIICLRFDLLFEVAPYRLGPAIGARNPCGGAGIDPAVERLIALAQFLPFKTLKSALSLDRDQLLGDELLQPFGVDAARKVDVTGGPLAVVCDFFVGRPDAENGRSRS
jgi:hypothetical protein